MVLDKRKYRIGIFTELCLTHAAECTHTGTVGRLTGGGGGRLVL